MKAIMIAITTIGLVAPAKSEGLQIDAPSQEALAGIAKSAQQSGLNCPIATDLSKIAENEHGWIIRVGCSSGDGKHKWFIRLSGYPNWEPQFSSFDDPVPPNREMNLRKLKRP